MSTFYSAETLFRSPFSAPSSFTSDSKCLHSLVSWAHHHGEGCRSCPDLKEVLEGQCWGSVKVVWGCVDGHSYTMDNRCTTATNPAHAMSLNSGRLGGGRGDGVMSEVEEQEVGEENGEQTNRNGRTAVGNISTLAPNSPLPVSAQTQSSELPHWTSNIEGKTEIIR